MRIAVVLEQPPNNAVSGGRYHGWLFSCGLVAIGYDVTIFSQSEPPFYAEFTEHYKVPRLVHTNALDRLQQGGFDLIVGYPILASEWAIEYARRIGAPCWNFVLDAWPLVSKYAPAVAKRMHFGESHTRALRDSDLVLSISHYAVPFIKEWIGSDGVIGFMGCVNSRCADSVSVQTKSNYFIAVTRMTEHKRFSDLLHVARKTGSHLKVITSFDSAEMVEQIRREGVSGLVRIVQSPTDEEKFRLMKSAVAYIGASAYEGLGMPFMEAVYCGLPVICYDYPVLREVCGEGALYAKHSSPESLSEKAGKLMKDNGLYIDTSVQAYGIGKRYSFEAMCDRLRGLFDGKI